MRRMRSGTWAGRSADRARSGGRAAGGAGAGRGAGLLQRQDRPEWWWSFPGPGGGYDAWGRSNARAPPLKAIGGERGGRETSRDCRGRPGGAQPHQYRSA